MFCKGPLVKVDPLRRCDAVLVCGLQMIVLNAAEVFQMAIFLLLNMGLTSIMLQLDAPTRKSSLILLTTLEQHKGISCPT
ncbi:hypothetical protein Pfo_014916 [Paulownia fortunei]|nr:hypothetical protein Pfo_014916 [Paulownia fortunei]